MRAGMIPLLLSLLLATVSADYTYTACSKQADCTDKSYPYCKIIWNDSGMTTISTAVEGTKYSGVCVQCNSDCDCDLDEYCANDFSLYKVESAIKTTAAAYKEESSNKILTYYDVMKNYKIRSVCKKRELPKDYEFCVPWEAIRNDIITSVYK